MAIFKRVSNILTANINDMLDRVENPEKMVKQIVREMEEAVQVSKRNVAHVLASQKKVEKEIQSNKRLRDEWQAKAQKSVDMDRDDLAREALQRKKEYENVAVTLEREYDEGQKTAESLRQTLKALEAKLAEAKRRKTMLVARKRTAEAQVVAETGLARGMGSAGTADSFAKFEHFEDKVLDSEAEAAGLQELNEAEVAADAELNELGETIDVENELEEMKRKSKKGKAGKNE